MMRGLQHVYGMVQWLARFLVTVANAHAPPTVFRVGAVKEVPDHLEALFFFERHPRYIGTDNKTRK